MSSIINQLFPEGLQTTIQRQLNRLPLLMRPVLTAVSVVGETVDLALLTQLIRQETNNISVHEWLVYCVSAGVLEIENETARFANDALRHMLLDTLDEQEKARWHGKIGIALEAIYATNMSQAATNAFHWQQAGNREKEQQYARLAGEYASDQYAYDTAVQYFNRALELTADTALNEKFGLLLAREAVFNVLGNRDAQKDDLIQLAEIAYELTADKPAWRTEVALRLGNFAKVTGEYTVAIVAATEAERMARESHNKAQEAASLLLWGQALLRRGKYEAAQERLALSHQQAVTYRFTAVEADSLRFLGVIALDLGKFAQAEKHFEAALTIYRALEDKRGESSVLNNRSIVAYSQKRLIEAMSHWEAARSVFEAIGDKEGVARVLSNLSAVSMDLGDYEKGRAFSQDALVLCRESDLRFGQGMNLINLSLFNYYLGFNKQSEIFSRAALELAREMKSKPLEGLALKDRGYLLAQQQRWDEAAVSYQQALAVWQELSQPLQIIEAQAGLAWVALGQSDLDQAQQHIQPVVDHLQSGESVMGSSRPFFIYQVLYQLLTAIGDAQAEIILAEAYEQLTLFAAEITDQAQQQAFFQNVLEHKQIYALFTQAAQSG